MANLLLWSNQNQQFHLKFFAFHHARQLSSSIAWLFRFNRSTYIGCPAEDIRNSQRGCCQRRAIKRASRLSHLPASPRHSTKAEKLGRTHCWFWFGSFSECNILMQRPPLRFHSLTSGVPSQTNSSEIEEISAPSDSFSTPEEEEDTSSQQKHSEFAFRWF